MKRTEYLYDHKPNELVSMGPGLIDRIEKGKVLLHKLQDTPLVERDFARIDDVRNAIEHNIALLEGEV